MRRSLLLLFLFIVVYSHAQFTASYTELRSIPKTDLRKNIGSDSLLNMDIYKRNGEIHYLLPFYKAAYYEKELLKQDTTSYVQDLSQSLAFVGDIKSITTLQKQFEEKLTPALRADAIKLADSTNGFVYEDARRYILSKTKKQRVVMINEAHDNPMHRMFTTSLLEEMYNQGFRYLAMEMLNNFSSRAITKVDMLAGHYVSEPMAGELVRKAIELGYTLYPYEDTAISAHHTVNQREFAQAENLAALLKKDPAAKILVHAGYNHINEAALADNFIPMASYFKIVSGLDPLTINQTNMSEGSVGPFENEVYKQWIRKHPITVSTVALQGDKPVDIAGMIMTDIYVIHPPVKYLNERPTYMPMTGKKEITISPSYKSAFLIQAYYLKEYNEKTFATAIPADQTYNSASSGLYSLYLNKGTYKIISRDKNYTVLGSKDIEVK